MNKTPKIKILISCHKPTSYIQNEILEPIQLNCAGAKKLIPNMLHDNDGENISDKNPQYCELTAQYWAWKNLDADYYGFCHYRRYFNFSNTVYPEDPYGNIVEEYPGEFTIAKYGLDEENIRDVIGDNDIVITERKDITKMPGTSAKNIIDQYKEASLLKGKDIDTMQEIINDLTPEYSESAKKHLYGKFTSFCNMYILKKEIFFEYCEWMFKILDEFCKRTDMSDYSIEALRTPGHLSERLFGIFLDYYKKSHQDLKVKELQCVWFKETAPQEPLEPAFKENAVPVVLAANNDFIPVFATCLQSVLNNTSEKSNYDIILIHSDVNEDNKATLLEMVAPHKNVSLRFLNACRFLSDYKLVANEHISTETYYRFLIQDAIKGYDKVLYIDCDLIVKNDLAELYKTDVSGYALAATHDADFSGQVNGAVPSTAVYAKDVLKLEKPFEYAQAGVILFNVKEMKKLHTTNEWLDFCQEGFMYSDQDVINKYCVGKIKTLDMSWNVLMDNDHDRIKRVISQAPKYIQDEYFEARKHPYIVHFAGFKKPWYDPAGDYAHEFWTTARKTPYYEELLFTLNDKRAREISDALARDVSFRGKAKNRSKRLIRMVIRNERTREKVVRKLRRS